VSVRVIAAGVVLATVTSVTAAVPSAPRFNGPPVVQSDLDAFMEQVLAKRDENWKKLQQYILEEQEKVNVRGPANVPIWGEVREYAWFIREGHFVRSPTKVNGVVVSEEDRQKAEDQFLRRAKARDERAAKEQQGADPNTAGTQVTGGGTPATMDALLTQTRRPEFIDAAYFLRFKFEAGKYALAGRETFDGQEVLRIEYYPSKLFSHEQDAQDKRQDTGKKDPEEDMEATIERLMNKVSLVTLWVEPKAHQIVKYTFDNVHMDFLPAAWLMRVDGLNATMTMSQPFKDVWLPRDVDMFFSAMFAAGRVSGRFHIDYHDYREAATSARIKVGGGGPLR